MVILRFYDRHLESEHAARNRGADWRQLLDISSGITLKVTCGITLPPLGPDIDEVAMIEKISRKVGARILIGVSAGLLCSFSKAAAPPMYVAIPLGSVGGTQSEGHAINQVGHTTGFAFVRGDAAYHAFLATTDVMLDLGSPTDGSSTGTALNAHDDVVLNSSITIPPQPFGHGIVEWYAFRYSNGAMESIDSGVDRKSVV